MTAIKSVAGMALACALLAPSMQTGTVYARARGATLGGTPQAWRAAMGRPSPWQKGDSMGWATCPGTRIDQVVVTFENGRAQSNYGTPCTKRLSARTALAQARRFFPPDARAARSRGRSAAPRST